MPTQPPGRPKNIDPDIERMFRGLRQGGSRFAWKLLIPVGLVVFLLWLSTGWYIVAPDERGAVLRFGRLARVTEPGPHLLLPWPFEQVSLTKVTEVQRLEVGFRTLDNGKYKDNPEEALMLTGDENIVSLEFIVQYQVKAGDEGGYAVSEYLFSLESSPGDEQKNQTVKEVAEAAMREVVGRCTTDMVLTEGKDQVQEETMKLMQSILDRYKAGVQVTAVQLQDVQPPTEEVRAAFKDVASAREDKSRAMQEAEAYSNDILPRARGEADAVRAAAEGYSKSRVAEAEGETDRFLSILAEYVLAKDVTRERLYLETMEEVLGSADKIIVDTKISSQMLPYLPLRAEKGPKP